MLYFKLHQGCLLRKAVSPLVGIHADGFVLYSPEKISLTFTDEEQTFMGVLRLRSSDFQIFECDGEGITVVNDNELYEMLLRVDIEESVIMYGDYGDFVAQFLILHHSTYVGHFGDLKLYYMDEEDELVDCSRMEYELVVGITAEKFRFILRNLVAPQDEVSMFITDKQVKFSTEKGEIVLQTERSECIIGGIFNEPVQLYFKIEYIKQLWKASRLSSMVWILEAAKEDIQFNFPFGALGNIMFQFGDHS